jgi:hypothetical protein
MNEVKLLIGIAAAAVALVFLVLGFLQISNAFDEVKDNTVQF